MVNIVFVEANGARKQVSVPAGDSVMAAALANDIKQILADCGGAMSCATCHVHIAPEWLDRVCTADADERAMLEMAIDPDETSRLSCQIIVTDDLDGLVVNLPVSQL
jgi:2Fe-2S ferredoxin